jgi:hypothetical protein
MCTENHVYVRTIMLCHNFLIGKGHTCAPRTTCVLGGYTAASASVHVYLRSAYVHIYHGTFQWYQWWYMRVRTYVQIQHYLKNELKRTMVPYHLVWYSTIGTLVPWYHGTYPGTARVPVLQYVRTMWYSTILVCPYTCTYTSTYVVHVYEHMYNGSTIWDACSLAWYLVLQYCNTIDP